MTTRPAAVKRAGVPGTAAAIRRRSAATVIPLMKKIRLRRSCPVDVSTALLGPTRTAATTGALKCVTFPIGFGAVVVGLVAVGRL